MHEVTNCRATICRRKRSGVTQREISQSMGAGLLIFQSGQLEINAPVSIDWREMRLSGT